MHPFDSLLRAKAVWVPAGGCGEGKMKERNPPKAESPVLSAVLNEVRTFYIYSSV